MCVSDCMMQLCKPYIADLEIIYSLFASYISFESKVYTVCFGVEKGFSSKSEAYCIEKEITMKQTTKHKSAGEQDFIQQKKTADLANTIIRQRKHKAGSEQLYITALSCATKIKVYLNVSRNSFTSFKS